MTNSDLNSLQDIMISRVRVKILELFYTNPKEMYYVREITRAIKEEINAVRRELDRLLTTSLLKSEQRGNRLYYTLNPKYLFYPEIQALIAKTSGLGYELRKAKRKLGTVDHIMFSGRFVRGLTPHQGEVDMLVIGDVVMAELEAIVKAAESKIGREIYYTVFSNEEFEFRKTRRDPFIMDALYGSRVMIIGSEDDFVDRKSAGLG